jgi:hypothetical protein
MNNERCIVVGSCVAGALAGAWVYWRFQQDLRAASERVARGGQIMETECGLINPSA